MDSHPNQSPNLNMPPMGVELGPTRPSTNHELGSATHQPERVSVPEVSGGQIAPPPILPVLPVDTPIAQSVTVPADDHHMTDNAFPISDESKDLISKEWIIRAKQIVERTRDDPYTQSREFNKLKAEYIKQRYNMTIKVNNE